MNNTINRIDLPYPDIRLLGEPLALGFIKRFEKDQVGLRFVFEMLHNSNVYVYMMDD